MTRPLVILLALLLAPPAWAGRAVVDWRGGVNVRSDPGGKLKGKLPAGAEAETVGERGDWVQIRYADGEGWVVRKSLRMVAERPPEPAVSPVPPPPQNSEPATAGPKGVDVERAPAAPPLAVRESPTPAAPQEGGYLAGYDRDAGPAKVDTGPSLFTVVSALLLVLALVAGAVYLIKILSNRRYFGSQKGRGIQVLATRPLGPRQALVLVEVGGIPLLLAQGEAGVSLIAEIRDPEALRRLNDLYGLRETPFEAELNRRLDLESGEGGSGPEGAAYSGPSPDHVPPPPQPGPAGRTLSPEERLAALRRRRSTGEGP